MYERDLDHARSHALDDVTADARRPGRASASAALDGPTKPVASGIVMRKGDGAAAEHADDAVAHAASSTGHELPADLRTRFESSLGTDLSDVRVHTGAESQAAASAVSARAFAIGNDVHFGSGEYDPSSQSGQHLLAHEVAHTVQQRGGAVTRQNKLAVSQPGDTHEVEADHAAEAMVRGAPAQVATAPQTISRKPAPARDVPMPPGYQVLTNLQPVSTAVKAGEASGAGSIPSPAGLYDVAERNYTTRARHCINVQAHYAGQAGGVSVPIIGDLGGNHHFASFARTASKAHEYCENGAVLANAASAAINMWVPLLQSSQSDWAEVKKAASKANIDVLHNADGTTALEGEGVEAEGEQLRGLNKLASPKEVEEAGPEASAKEKADIERRKASSDKDIADGKNIKSESKVLLDEATTNFEQSMSEVTTSRRNVVTSHGAARSSLMNAKVKATQARQSAAEEDKAKIDEILALVDKAQAAIEKGRGIVENEVLDHGIGDKGWNAHESVGPSISGIRASQVATMVLQLDGTLPTIEGEIAACKAADGNLKAIINEGAIQSAGQKYADTLKAFSAALKKLPERAKKFEAAHKAYAESVNQALIKRGMLKPGEDGVKPMMELLGKLRVACASTSAAVAATADVHAAVSALNGLGAPPSPDVCRLSDLAAAHAKAFGTGPRHVGIVQGVLAAREAALKDYLSKVGI